MVSSEYNVELACGHMQQRRTGIAGAQFPRLQCCHHKRPYQLRYLVGTHPCPASRQSLVAGRGVPLHDANLRNKLGPVVLSLRHLLSTQQRDVDAASMHSEGAESK